MKFIDSIDNCVFKKYADFNGKASKSEYWWFWLFYVSVSFGFPTIAFLVSELSSHASGGGIFSFVFLLICFVVAIGGICPFLAVSVRRLHDSGLSGFHVLWGIIPYIGPIITIILMCRNHRD